MVVVVVALALAFFFAAASAAAAAAAAPPPRPVVVAVLPVADAAAAGLPVRHAALALAADAAAAAAAAAASNSDADADGDIGDDAVDLRLLLTEVPLLRRASASSSSSSSGSSPDSPGRVARRDALLASAAALRRDLGAMRGVRLLGADDDDEEEVDGGGGGDGDASASASASVAVAVGVVRDVDVDDWFEAAAAAAAQQKQKQQKRNKKTISGSNSNNNSNGDDDVDGGDGDGDGVAALEAEEEADSSDPATVADALNFAALHHPLAAGATHVLVLSPLAVPVPPSSLVTTAMAVQKKKKNAVVGAADGGAQPPPPSSSTAPSSLASLVAQCRVGACGAMAGRVLDGKNRVYADGVGFALEALPAAVSSSSSSSYGGYDYGGSNWWDTSSSSSSSSSRDRNVVAPHLRLRGMHAHTRDEAAAAYPLRALSSVVVLIPRATLAQHDGFRGRCVVPEEDETTESDGMEQCDPALALPLPFVIADWCLRVAGAGGATVSVGERSLWQYFGPEAANEFRDDDEEVRRNALLDLHARYGSALREEVERRYDPRSMGVGLVWNSECGTGQVLGFTTEMLGIIHGLDGRLPLKVEVGAGNLRGCIDALRGIGLPEGQLDALERVAGIHIEDAMDHGTKENTTTVLVLHRDPGRYGSFLSSSEVQFPDVVVGRSMYETDTIPVDWVQPCNTIVDEIWVPSEWNVGTFAGAGVHEELLRAVPEAVDVHAYSREHAHGRSPSDPRYAHADPLFDLFDLVSAGERRRAAAAAAKAAMREADAEAQGGIDATTVDDSSSSSVWAQRAAAPRVPPSTAFAFLSVMKWEERKDWQTLVHAYFDAFSANDDVVLVIRASMDESNWDEFDALVADRLMAACMKQAFDEALSTSTEEEEEEEEEEEQEKEAGESSNATEAAERRSNEESKPKKPKKAKKKKVMTAEEKAAAEARQHACFEREALDLPEIRVLEEKVPFWKMPDLYASADCVVLASHGEGWGLPLAEAMAMGVPVIATNWSGSTAFATEDTALLVPVRSMVAVPGMPGHHWAQPDREVLQRHMQTVFASSARRKKTTGASEEEEAGGGEGGSSPARLAERARQVMARRFSPRAVGSVILDRLADLHQRAPGLAQKREEARQAEELLEQERARRARQRQSIRIND